MPLLCDCFFDYDCSDGYTCSTGGCDPVEDYTGRCIQDGSPIFGCTDPLATNYDDQATVDNGSCEYPCCVDEGWIGPDGVSAGSCWMATAEDCNVDYIDTVLYTSYTSCEDTVSDGYYGCGGLVPDSVFASCEGICGQVHSSGCSCTEDCGNNCCDDFNTFCIFGCIDSTATNYNPFATEDDGSCEYELDPVGSCEYDSDCPPHSFCVAGVCIPDEDTPDPSEYPCCTTEALYNNGSSADCSMKTSADCWTIGGASYSSFSSCGDAISAGYYWCGGEAPEPEPGMICVGTLESCSSYQAMEDYEESGCTSAAPDYCMDEDRICVRIDGTSCSSFQIESECISPCSWIEATYGCMDSDADNYDVNATVDDGSCEYWGCMDWTSTTYDPNATVDDGSCEYSCLYICGFDHPSGVCSCTEDCVDNNNCCEDFDTLCIFGCTNSYADNYNPGATVDDGSCEVQENVVYVSDIPSFGISKDTFAISPVGADKTEMLGFYLPAPVYGDWTFGFGRWSHLSDFYCGTGYINLMKGFSTTDIDNANYTFENIDSDCIDCRPLDSAGNLITDSEGISNHYSEIRNQFSDTAWEMFQCICGDLIEYYGAEGIGSLDSNCHSGCMITNGIGYCGYASDPDACYSAINDLCIDQCTGDSSDLVFNRNACDQFTNNYNRGGWVIENEVITQYDLTITNNDTGNTFSSTSFPYDRLAGDANNIFFRNFISDGHDITFTNLDEGNYTATIAAITENESGETQSTDFEVRDIIPIMQSISNTVLPWQGIHFTFSGLQNTKDNWDNYDLDKRPSLGTFYYDDDNIRREDWLYDGFDDEFNRQLDECSSPEFTPDADVRMFRTTGISNSLLWKYWDNNIQPSSYQETVAPIEVQVYLYPRSDGNLFDVRDVDRINYKLGYYYAAYIDWDDGTPIEYNTGEPFELGYNNILKHSYEKAGIYEISGYMLRAEKSPEENNVTGICYNQYFTIRININEGDDNEFEYLGGDDYSTIPYKETVPVIGGVSKNSIYYKTLRRQLGYLDGDGISPSISTEFERIGDRLRVENALATLDDTRIGPLQSTFTGSYNENGSVIYGGSFKTFGELGDSLGDADIGPIRYFDRSIQMYELIEGNQNTGNPDNLEYWKNIIPEDYNLLNREGITIDDSEIEIDENASQDWDGGYYYPVLPKLDRYGKFIEDMQRPLPIPAMDNSYMTGSLLINIEPEYIDSGVLNDSAGKGNVGMVIGDYKVSFDPKTREPKKERNASTIRIGRKDKAY